MASAEKLSSQVISKAFQPMALVLNIGIGGVVDVYFTQMMVHADFTQILTQILAEKNL